MELQMLSSGVKEYSEQFGDRDLDTPTMLLGGETLCFTELTLLA